MLKLQSALQDLSRVRFVGLENVLCADLLPAIPSYTPADIDKLRRHLRTCWFDPASASTFFPGISNVAQIYGEGLLKSLEQALERGVPIDAWWTLDHAKVDMLNFVTARQVTLIIATPRPPKRLAVAHQAAPAALPTIGFSTHDVDGTVETAKLPIPRQ
jgi:hypothetical protein